MLNTHEKFLFDDKRNKFFAEINWEDNQETNECKIIKFTFPDGKDCYVPKKLLIEMLFAIGDKEEQMKMIPQKISRSKWYETVISVKVNKRIEKGELLIFPLKITLPTVEEEVVAEIKKGIPIIH